MSGFCSVHRPQVTAPDCPACGPQPEPARRRWGFDQDGIHDPDFVTATPRRIIDALNETESLRAERDELRGRVRTLLDADAVLLGTCDWGGCDATAVMHRESPEYGLLPVCERHTEAYESLRERVRLAEAVCEALDGIPSSKYRFPLTEMQAPEERVLWAAFDNWRQGRGETDGAPHSTCKACLVGDADGEHDGPCERAGAEGATDE